MKFKILLLLLILSAGNISAGTTSPQSKKHQSWSADNGNGTYTNPLFYDEFTDPDIIRVGKDYYLAGTTMHCVPGIVILHSTDMVNWELDRKSTRLNSSHQIISYAVFCLKKKKNLYKIGYNVGGESGRAHV